MYVHTSSRLNIHASIQGTGRYPIVSRVDTWPPHLKINLQTQTHACNMDYSVKGRKGSSSCWHRHTPHLWVTGTVRRSAFSRHLLLEQTELAVWFEEEGRGIMTVFWFTNHLKCRGGAERPHDLSPFTAAGLLSWGDLTERTYLMAGKFRSSCTEPLDPFGIR